MKILLKELEKIKDEVMGILIYGSYARSEECDRSDIDVCVVAGYNDKKRLKELFRKLLQIIGRDKRYDIKIFEYLPLYMKIKIIEEGKPILTEDVPGLYEYFYFYRKLWNDQAVVKMEER